MSKKITEFTLKDFVCPTVGKKFIDLSRKTSFLVTFETGATEDGHNTWLKEKFECWKREIEETTNLVVNSMGFKKKNFFKKNSQGSVSVGIDIKGVFKPGVAGNSTFNANLSSMIRKFLAENLIMAKFRPDFNLKNPLFDALHIHKCIFSLGASDWKKAQKEIDSLCLDTFDLSLLIDDCGAMLIEPNFEIIKGRNPLDNVRFAITLRWKSDASDDKRDTLKKVIDAYFKGKKLHIGNWRIESIGQQQPE